MALKAQLSCNEVVLVPVVSNLYMLMLILVVDRVFEWVCYLAPTFELVWFIGAGIWIELTKFKWLLGWLVLGWFKSIDWPAVGLDQPAVVQPNRVNIIIVFYRGTHKTYWYAFLVIGSSTPLSHVPTELTLRSKAISVVQRRPTNYALLPSMSTSVSK